MALPPKCSWEDEGDDLPPLPEWKSLSPPPSPVKDMVIPQLDGVEDESDDEEWIEVVDSRKSIMKPKLKRNAKHHLSYSTGGRNQRHVVDDGGRAQRGVFERWSRPAERLAR